MTDLPEKIAVTIIDSMPAESVMKFIAQRLGRPYKIVAKFGEELEPTCVNFVRPSGTSDVSYSWYSLSKIIELACHQDVAELKSPHSPTFSHTAFTKLVDETLAQCREIMVVKGGEYAGDNDRLANFRRNAAAQGLHMEAIWGVYAAKHWDSLMQYIQDTNTGKTRVRGEPLSGRADDLINYLLLFKAMLVERGEA